MEAEPKEKKTNKIDPKLEEWTLVTKKLNLTNKVERLYELPHPYVLGMLSEHDIERELANKFSPQDTQSIKVYLKALGEPLVNKENRFRQTVMLDKLYSKIHTNFRKGEWVILTLIPKSSPRPNMKGISEVDIGTLPGAEDFVLDSDFCCLVGNSAENTLAFLKATASQLRLLPTLYQTRVGYEQQEGVRMEREKRKRSHGQVQNVPWAGPPERFCFKVTGIWTFTGHPASPARLLMYDSLEGGLGSIERANCPPGEYILTNPIDGRGNQMQQVNYETQRVDNNHSYPDT
jgi:hypothetical protein